MQPIRRVEIQTVHQELQGHIREYILANALRPGDPLPTEAQLAEQLGVSRPILREGLRALESLGVIYSRRGEGRYVSSFRLEPIFEGFAYGALFEANQISDLLDVRERLEVSFIADVIAVIDEDSLEQLRQIVAEMRTKMTIVDEFWITDLKFHRLMYETVNNAVLLRLLDMFWEIFRNLRDRSLLPSRDPERNVAHHGAILAAIEARDIGRAQQEIASHFEDLRLRLQDAERTESHGVAYLQPKAA